MSEQTYLDGSTCERACVKSEPLAVEVTVAASASGNLVALAHA
jgi:hypothetical protein